MKAKRNQKEIAAIARSLSVSTKELQNTIEKQMRELDPDGL